MPNSNTPVLVGVAQILQRITDPLEGKEPLLLMLDAAQAAATDTESASILSAIDSVRVIRGIWRYNNPAQFIADKLGLGAVETVGSCYGGNMVQSLVNQSARDILAGNNSVILMTGAENGNSLAKAQKAGLKLESSVAPGKYTRMFGIDQSMSNDIESALGIRQPIQVYPMFENAIRYNNSETIAEHARRISELWAGFSRVASSNPNAWMQTRVDAETIRTASPTNRMVSFPYPKLMNSNNAVDMSSALILCSVSKARALGIPASKWVYPWSGTDADDKYYLSNRDNFYASAAIRIAGQKVLALAGMRVSDIDLVDVYSCFPAAVQVAVKALGLDPAGPLTVTGGLTFGGGPLNNYVMHSIARMVELLRTAPGDKGLITANGGFLTKHAFGVYSTEAPAGSFQYANVQEQVDATPARNVVAAHDGEVTIETYSVMYDARGPAIGHVACLLPDSRRAWANISHRDTLRSMVSEEYCGRAARLNRAGCLTPLH